MIVKRFETIVAAAFATLILLLGCTALATADEVSISLVTDVTGSAGSTITVFGNLTNTTASTQYFGNDAINLTAPSAAASASDDIILNGLFGTQPTSIAGGATISDVDLFSVQIFGGSGTYTGNNFQLFGGTDAVGCENGASDCDNVLGTAKFSMNVAPVPLPATAWLMLCGLGGVAAMARRKCCA
jgi:hypothetical protein